ncbi:MAG: hypothetical protein IJ901_09000 [Bacteroidaceae bacterium]|nr:hypothetical protein [Bacteroidaceae bacterium]
MKKTYMKPAMQVIYLQSKTQLLIGSGGVNRVRSTGWSNSNPDDELELSTQGGGNSIFDR